MRGIQLFLILALNILLQLIRIHVAVDYKIIISLIIRVKCRGS